MVKNVTETFLQRIPTLSERELLDYLHGARTFKPEAVAAALSELQRRGHAFTPAELEAVRHWHESREPQPFQAHGFLRDAQGPRLPRIRLVSGLILATGLGSALVIYFHAIATASPEYELEESKAYLRGMEVIGGKANLLGAEFMHWFTHLWQGVNLAYSIAVITILLAVGFWIINVHGPDASR
jgi:hypothetical protein